MARIRSIKPEFWTSEEVMECSPIARLMFIGMWNFADDVGRLPLSPKTIKAQIFPNDPIEVDTIRGMIDELASNTLLRIYAVDGKEYLQITGWHHQRIDKPQKAKYPEFQESSPSIPRTFPPDTIGEEGKGKDSEAKASAANGTFEGSDEDQFWSLADPAAKAGIARSRLGQLIKFSDGDFRAALSILKSTLRKKEPAAYLGKALASMRDETKLDAAVEARDPSIPEFVREAKAEGIPVKRRGENWEIGPEIFNAEGRMIGF